MGSLGLLFEPLTQALEALKFTVLLLGLRVVPIHLPHTGAARSCLRGDDGNLEYLPPFWKHWRYFCLTPPSTTMTYQRPKTGTSSKLRRFSGSRNISRPPNHPDEWVIRNHPVFYLKSVIINSVFWLLRIAPDA